MPISSHLFWHLFHFNKTSTCSNERGDIPNSILTELHATLCLNPLEKSKYLDNQILWYVFTSYVYIVWLETAKLLNWNESATSLDSLTCHPHSRKLGEHVGWWDLNLTHAVSAQIYSRQVELRKPFGWKVKLQASKKQPQRSIYDYHDLDELESSQRDLNQSFESVLRQFITICLAFLSPYIRLFQPNEFASCCCLITTLKWRLDCHFWADFKLCSKQNQMCAYVTRPCHIWSD